MIRFLVFGIFFVLVGCGGGGGSGGGAAVSSVASVGPSSGASSSIISSSSSLSSSSSIVSVSSEISSSVSVSPLLAGIGTISTRFVLGGSYIINEQNGLLEKLESSLSNSYIAADIDSDGVVVAASATGKNIDEIDLISGVAVKLFDAPEEISAIAIAPNGVVVGISKNEEFGKKSIYRFNRTGLVLSKATLANLKPGGIDFDKDGNLYASDLFGFWKVDSVSGLAESIYVLNPSGQSDIDIDAAGKIRLISFGELYIYKLDGGSLEKKVTLQYDYFSFSPLVHY